MSSVYSEGMNVSNIIPYIRALVKGAERIEVVRQPDFKIYLWRFMNDSGKLTFVLAGCGDSYVHASALKNTPGTSIGACCDMINRAPAWADKYGCRAYYSNLGTMLKMKNRTRPILHLAEGPSRTDQVCLLSGVKNILCEKSLATSGKDARDNFKNCGKTWSIYNGSFDVPPSSRH